MIGQENTNTHLCQNIIKRIQLTLLMQ